MFLKLFPEYLVHGPWHTSVSILLPLVSIAIFYSRKHLTPEHRYDDGEGKLTPFLSDSVAHKLKILLSAYGFAVLYYMKKSVGLEPLVSYTMQSWLWTTLRFTFGALSGDRSTALQQVFHDIEEFLRFPSLAQNTVTFVIWWAVLTPIISVALSKKRSSLKAFWEWNTSPFLLTVHGINLPFALAGHLLTPRHLVLQDLWNGSTVAISYLWFYLTVLDANKIPLYIILSPRSRAAPFVYLSILALYHKLYSGFNHITPHALDFFTQQGF